MRSKTPVALGWWQRFDGKFQFSLRSRGDIDVSEIAKKFGGGGHKNAAGFQLKTLPEWVVASPTRPDATMGFSYDG